MPEEAEQSLELMGPPPRVNELRRFLKVFLGRPVVVFGAIIIVVLIICAAFPQWIAPYDPIKQNLRSVLLQPSSEHLLGTDALGRDLLSRIIFGARTAVMVGVVALGIAAVSGMILGLTAGYFGGITYAIIMRFIDALMAFPVILLALAIAALLGGGLLNVMIAIGIGMMAGYARVMCGQAISVRENDYILAARSSGASNLRIMFRHVFPNCFPPMIVLMTMMIGMTILFEAGLSFLGIGIKEPTVAWGSLVNDGYKYLLTHPLLSVAPGVAIIFVVYAFNMVGDGIRDAIDPRLRGTL
ncbi:MAG TPA: ABC transporter permease [Dehalococcoidales bacterium]|nr:ABC transporter permease [Dehalococcoidales bacterium]